MGNTWQVGDKRAITHTFTRDEIEAFAKLTGDVNPLHVDEEFANRTAAGGQVVHGMLAASFISTLIGVHIPGRGALWNSFEINWRKMIRIGDTLRFEARVDAVRAGTSTLELEITGTNAVSGEVYLDGKARVMIMSEQVQVPSVKLAGRRVLVTGASGELGGAICKALAGEGCRLILWGRNPERLERLANQIGESVDSFHAVDLTNDALVYSVLAEVRENGGADGFVHAAAAPLHIAAVNDAQNYEYLKEHWQVEVAAFYRIAQQLSENMQSGGFIISILTQAVFDAPPTKMSAYVSAKMGAWGIVRALAMELAPKGIRCNAVSPNMMETPYIRDMPVRAKQVEAASNPMRRLCTVEDVAGVVKFLAGPEAVYINGANLPVTGGSKMP